MTTPQHKLWLVAKSVLFCLLLVALLAGTDFVMRLTRGPENGWPALPEFGAQADVIAIGTSLTYCTVMPMEMWRSRGITAINVTGERQRMRLTLAYAQQVLETYKPKVLVVDEGNLGKQDGLLVSTVHNNLDPMPWSRPRVSAITATLKPADWAELFFPLSLYHDRWQELTRNDFRADKHTQGNFAKGAAYYTVVTPVQQELKHDIVTEEDYLEDLGNLKSIARLCKAKGVQMVLMGAPRGEPIYIDDVPLNVRLRADLKDEFPDIDYVDLNEHADVMRLDPKRDFLEPNGGHMNFGGAVKASKWFADYLADTYDLPDHRGDALAAEWNQDLKTFDQVFLPMP